MAIINHHLITDNTHRIIEEGRPLGKAGLLKDAAVNHLVHDLDGRNLSFPDQDNLAAMLIDLTVVGTEDSNNGNYHYSFAWNILQNVSTQDEMENVLSHLDGIRSSSGLLLEEELVEAIYITKKGISIEYANLDDLDDFHDGNGDGVKWVPIPEAPSGDNIRKCS